METTFYIQKQNVTNDVTNDVTNNVINDVVDNDVEKGVEKRSEMLKTLRKKNTYSTRKLTNILNDRQRTLQQHLRKILKEENKIIYEGAPKIGGYFIKE